MKEIARKKISHQAENPVPFTADCQVVSTPRERSHTKNIEYIHDEEIYEFCKELSVETQPSEQQKSLSQAVGNTANKLLSYETESSDLFVTKQDFSGNIHNYQIKRKTELKCDKCFKEFNCIRSLRRHYICHQEKLPYKCPHCDKRFSTTANISRHINYKHEMTKRFACSQCDYACFESTKLKNHMLKHSKDLKKRKPETAKDISKREKKNKCKFCSESFVQITQLTRHVNKWHEELLEKCDRCPFKFQNKQKLMDHVALHSNKNAYHCEKCNAVFKVEHKLKAHIKSNHSRNECNYCSREFNSAERLQTHIETEHDSSGPMRCLKCSEVFLEKHKWMTHVCKILSTRASLNNVTNATTTRRKEVRSDTFKHQKDDDFPDNNKHSDEDSVSNKATFETLPNTADTGNQQEEIDFDVSDNREGLDSLSTESEEFTGSDDTESDNNEIGYGFNIYESESEINSSIDEIDGEFINGKLIEDKIDGLNHNPSIEMD
ncbi:hypothetical protein KUTeg_014539, partial [Tegillarca granosa]